MDASQPLEPARAVAAPTGSDGDGVDVTLIRWMLALSPSERLDALQGFVDSVVELRDGLRARRAPAPAGRSHLADQLTRAATSIVLNIAEGAGKFSKADKRRYYLTAAGSTTESAAICDVCLRLQLVSSEVHDQGKKILDRIMSMLVKLAKALGE